jgi:hypothetical protein
MLLIYGDKCRLRFRGLYLTPTEITDPGSMINVCYNSE